MFLVVDHRTHQPWLVILLFFTSWQLLASPLLFHKLDLYRPCAPDFLGPSKTWFLPPSHLQCHQLISLWCFSCHSILIDGWIAWAINPSSTGLSGSHVLKISWNWCKLWCINNLFFLSACSITNFRINK